jgi:hypothetical protein
VSLREQLKEEIKSEIFSTMEKDLLKEQILKELREDFEVTQKLHPIFVLSMYSFLLFFVLEGFHRVFLK